MGPRRCGWRKPPLVCFLGRQQATCAAWEGSGTAVAGNLDGSRWGMAALPKTESKLRIPPTSFSPSCI